MVTQFILWLSKLLQWSKGTELDSFPKPPQAPNEPAMALTTFPTPAMPTEAHTASSAMIDTFCQAITDYEGKPGDLNYLLNNPGDCRPSPVGYLPKYQPVHIIDTNTNPKYPYHKGKFAQFPTYEIGWEYLVNMVHTMATNHPNWTILDFFSHFAPTSDGNAPLPYANAVAARCGVTTTTTLQKLFS